MKGIRDNLMYEPKPFEGFSLEDLKTISDIEFGQIIEARNRYKISNVDKEKQRTGKEKFLELAEDSREAGRIMSVANLHRRLLSKINFLRGLFLKRLKDGEKRNSLLKLLEALGKEILKLKAEDLK